MATHADKGKPTEVGWSKESVKKTEHLQLLCIYISNYCTEYNAEYYIIRFTYDPNTHAIPDRDILKMYLQTVNKFLAEGFQ